MCFYYSITKRSVNGLIKGNLLKNEQLSLFEDHFIVNGFDHPLMPVITDDQPETIQQFQWGFLPSMVPNPAEFLNKYNTLNAKAEDVSQSKLYAESLMNRRCLVLCSGFFEWHQVKKQKVPYYITLKGDDLFVFAGIWNSSRDSLGNSIQSFSIITTAANELMATIHNTKKRMPLILTPDKATKWLESGLNLQQLEELMIPLPASEMKAHTIKKFIPADAKYLNTADIIAYYHYPAALDVLGVENTLF